MSLSTTRRCSVRRAGLELVSGLHAYLNVNWASLLNDYLPEDKRKFNVAYIPVTCHLACPVTDYISKFSEAGEIFLPRMFQGFPEIKEALISNKMQAAFIVAPLAIALKAQGVPIKIVYLGHRYGSAVVVHKDGPVHTVADLRGRVVAIPSRFSDERLIRLPRDEGVRHQARRNQDGRDGAARRGRRARRKGHRRVFDGRAVSLAGGDGRLWPRAVSRAGVLAGLHVLRAGGAAGHDRQRPDAVQLLVDGVARSGLWLEKGKPYRENAADFVGRFYYNQNPALLRWALTKPLDSRHVHPARAPQGRLRPGARSDDRDRRPRPEDRVRRIHRQPVRRSRFDPDGVEVRARQRLGSMTIITKTRSRRRSRRIGRHPTVTVP